MLHIQLPNSGVNGMCLKQQSLTAALLQVEMASEASAEDLLYNKAE